MKLHEVLAEPEFMIQCGLFSRRMHLQSPQCALPIKLCVFGLILLITLLWVLQLDLGRSASWFQGVSLKPRYRGSVGWNSNGIWHFRMDTTAPQFEGASALSGDASCPSGFYSMEELRPQIERPQEDSEGPGADGNPFISGIMTPVGFREKQEGLSRNGFNQYASDRISFHRSLGVDTRPPEWESKEADWENLFLESFYTIWSRSSRLIPKDIYTILCYSFKMHWAKVQQMSTVTHYQCDNCVPQWGMVHSPTYHLQCLAYFTCCFTQRNRTGGWCKYSRWVKAKIHWVFRYLVWKRLTIKQANKFHELRLKRRPKPYLETRISPEGGLFWLGTISNHTEHHSNSLATTQNTMAVP